MGCITKEALLLTLLTQLITLTLLTIACARVFVQAYERYMDTLPGPVIHREMIPLLSHVKRKMGEFVGCEGRDLFLIENCSAGINVVLRSLSFTATDSILTLSLGYGRPAVFQSHCLITSMLVSSFVSSR